VSQAEHQKDLTAMNNEELAMVREELLACLFSTLPKQLTSPGDVLHMKNDLEYLRFIQNQQHKNSIQEPRQYDAYGRLKINGQEWYDRFWIEFLKGANWRSIRLTKAKIIRAAEQAAKKAAGLE
jgi:hypothetical protein